MTSSVREEPQLGGAATHMVVRLIRFDELVDVGDVTRRPGAGALWSEVAADTGAAGTLHGSSAHVFAAVDLFADADTATASFEAGPGAEPWAAGATEAWTGLFQAFRHHGIPEFDFGVNWLDPNHPSPLFTCGPLPPKDEPFAALTTVGWDVGPGLDPDRLLDFHTSAARVRDSMAGIEGLHSQQAFTRFAGFGPFALDEFTLTFWRDVPAMRAFAHGHRTAHEKAIERFHVGRTADRCSFTRLRVLDRSGSWGGSDPLACWDGA